MLFVIDTYLLVKESEGRAASTIYEYRLYLGAFATHCAKPLAEVSNTMETVVYTEPLAMRLIRCGWVESVSSPHTLHP